VAFIFTKSISRPYNVDGTESISNMNVN